MPFDIHLVGQQFRTRPAAFDELLQNYGGHVGRIGFIDRRTDYLALLRASDVVLSTALHDFQGIAVLEAVQAGCVPVVPDRLAYREHVPAEFRYRSEPADVQLEISAAVSMLKAYAAAKTSGKLPVAPPMEHLTIEALKPHYRAIFERCSKRCDRAGLNRSDTMRRDRDGGDRNA